MLRFDAEIEVEGSGAPPGADRAHITFSAGETTILPGADADNDEILDQGGIQVLIGDRGVHFTGEASLEDYEAAFEAIRVTGDEGLKITYDATLFDGPILERGTVVLSSVDGIESLIVTPTVEAG
jgi:hypothetical protein